MKKILTIFALTSLINMANAQKGDFEYTIESHMKNTQFFTLDLALLNIDYIGNHLNIGTGARFKAHHVVDKLSFDLGFKYRYFQKNLNNNRPELVVDQNLALPKGIEFGFNAYYTLFSDVKTVDETLSLSASRKTEYVTELPVKRFIDYELKIGLQRFDNPTFIQYVPEDFNLQSRNLYYMQRTGMFNIGVSRNRYSNTKYKTNKYGVLSNSGIVELYAEALISLGKRDPGSMTEVLYGNINNTFEATGYTAAQQSLVDAIIADTKYSPIGFRIGVSGGGLGKIVNLSWNAQGGILPGYRPDVGDNFTARFFINVGVILQLSKVSE